MVKVEGGDFLKGSKKSTASVKEFYIDKYEVTFEDFAKFQKDKEVPEGKEKHPVTEISYFDAEEYCKSVGKRLPTGDEWEKAARGTDGRTFPWGDEFNAENANTIDSGTESTSAVRSFEKGKSPYGAYNMGGNVWEWVDSWLSEEDKKYRFVRGGSFFDKSPMSATYSTLQSIPDDVHTYIGFRCAK